MNVQEKIRRHFKIQESGRWNSDHVSVSKDYVTVRLTDRGITFADLEFLSKTLETKDINIEGSGTEVGSEMTPMTEGYVTINCRNCKGIKL